jgi:hypothetical protein
MPVFSKVRHTIAAATAFSGIPVNVHDGTSQITWAVTLTGNGANSYDVEFTLDDLNDPEVSANWYDSVSAQTASNVGNITVPVRGIRLNCVTVSGSSDATFRVLQSGT